MNHLRNLSMCMAYGLPEFIMDAAVTALDSGTDTAMTVRDNMDRRREILKTQLAGITGLDIYSSVGGMYVVPDVRGLGVSSHQFSRDMLDRHDVSVLACDGFGETGRGLVRISLCADDSNMTAACERIVEYALSLPSKVA
jgi:arginine:pyruvate transaminase